MSDCGKCGEPLDDAGFCSNCMAGLVYRAANLLRSELSDHEPADTRFGRETREWLADYERLADQAIKADQP